jgi:hypothetical protein
MMYVLAALLKGVHFFSPGERGTLVPQISQLIHVFEPSRHLVLQKADVLALKSKSEYVHE